MSGNNEVNIKNLNNDSVAKSEEIFYEDDGFFSDVPRSGSLSRSLIALNKYMKKNLLYDEDEEYETDSAYFTKESSPNDFVTKYDSDSTKSNISVEKEQHITQRIDSDKTFIPPNEATSEPANEIAILRINKIIIEPVNENINTEPDIYIKPELSQPKNELTSEPSKTSSSDIVTNKVSSEKLNDITNESMNEIVDKQTDDYKSMKLLDSARNEAKNNYNIMLIESSQIDKAKHISASLDNIVVNTVSDHENKFEDRVIQRDKLSDIRRGENRHTMHDFSDWGNRTDIYPDVYAPLPYKSPRRYVESDVNIHYRCPVRHDPLPLVPERELARQQAEHMKRLYREQKRNKYLQENDIQPSDIEAFDASIKELQDMQNRRHQDNFTPSQKTVVPLNRYDEADRVIARALYTFNGQTPRELSFRKGELINVRRQIDANWYEGEVHGKIGLFPYNYVEIQKGDVIQAPKKPAVVEGRARAKFDFTAQTNLELPLKKGEVVVLTRRIDQNWWEGRNGVKTGIFPDSYVTILQEPSQSKPESQPVLNLDKPVASPAAHGLLNGSAKRSMGSHSYTPQPNSPALSNAPPATQPLPGYVARPAQTTLTPSERGYGPPTGQGVDLNNTEPLYVDTNAEAIPFRAMYKYRPQNPDELELNEGDTVYVLEKCDDGWYVGSSQRTGRFGTFPGNYVERI